MFLYIQKPSCLPESGMVATPFSFSFFEIMDKNRQVNIRVSETELRILKERAGNYKNLSSYILDACMKFDDSLTVGRIDLINSWAEGISKYKSDLAHLGNNINQLAHYVNNQISMGIYTSLAVQKELDLLQETAALLLSITEQNRILLDEFKKILRKK